MKSSLENFLSNNGRRIVFILFSFIMLYLISYLINPYSDFWKGYLSRPAKLIATELLLSLFFCILVSENKKSRSFNSGNL